MLFLPGRLSEQSTAACMGRKATLLPVFKNFPETHRKPLLQEKGMPPRSLRVQHLSVSAWNPILVRKE